jgi:hypothetical protein
MKKITAGFWLLSLTVPFLAGCGGQAAQGTQPANIVTPLTLSPPPIYALLGFRRELDLTSHQVAALDSIAQTVEDENRPLVRDLQAQSRDRARQAGVFEINPVTEPILEEIRANQRRAGEGVAALLNEEQQQTVCRLFDRSSQRPGGRPQQAAPARQTAGPAATRPVGWHWCAPNAERAEPASADASGSS